MKLLRFLAIFVALLGSVQGAQIETPTTNKGDVRVVPVDPTPEPDAIEIKVVLPEMNEVKNSNPVSLQMRIEGFPLGTDTDVPRSNEIFNDPDGQCLHVFIDNEPYFIINEALVDTLDDVDDYFDQIAQTNIPFELNPGMHVIRVLAVRSFNECLKGDKGFAATVFYMKTKKNNIGMNLHKPYLTYNEPQGSYDYSPTQPILLDFHIANCQLSKDGYKVRVSIDGTQRILTQWTPYYIYGLKKGKHRVRLELLDPENQPVLGLFSSAQKEVVLE